eukprot:scaffold54099_cov75-Phaeocystis_antarctica.AAC.1
MRAEATSPRSRVDSFLNLDDSAVSISSRRCCASLRLCASCASRCSTLRAKPDEVCHRAAGRGSRRNGGRAAGRELEHSLHGRAGAAATAAATAAAAAARARELLPQPQVLSPEQLELRQRALHAHLPLVARHLAHELRHDGAHAVAPPVLPVLRGLVLLELEVPRLQLRLPRRAGRLARGERGLARLEPRLAVRVHLLLVLELGARLLQVALLLVEQRRRREAALPPLAPPLGRAPSELGREVVAR